MDVIILTAADRKAYCQIIRIRNTDKIENHPNFANEAAAQFDFDHTVRTRAE